MKEDTKSLPITKEQVLRAYEEVRKHGKSSGVDDLTLKDYEAVKGDQLYKVWNRLSSGSYFPPAVKRVEIPKSDGKMRKLGIPTVNDRVAQTVVKHYLEPQIDHHFHPNSFGYRPHRNAHQAVKQASAQCWEKAWVIDLDIEGFFDNLDHELLMQALQRHTTEKWVLMYVERWLKAPIEHADGQLEHPKKGSPQGGVISPLLANLYLHYAFDKWMSEHYKAIVFERYADDIVVHCTSKAEAEILLENIRSRLEECGLRLHPGKTKIVYCKNSNRKGDHKTVSFDFLGFRFKPKKARNRQTGEIFTGYGPVDISNKTKKRIVEMLKSKKLSERRGTTLVELSKELGSHVRGWINYYGRIDMKIPRYIMTYINMRLIQWVKRHHKRFKGSTWQSAQWLRGVYRDYPNLFVHWQYGFKP